MGLFSGPRAERRDFGTEGTTIPPNSMQGGGSSLVNVSTESAMTLSAVWACVNLRASLVSTLPLEVFRMRAGAKEKVPTPQVLRAPGGARITLEEWLFSSQVSLDLRGNSYGWIDEFDTLGYPKQITLIHPDLVTVGVGLDGFVEYRIKGQKVATDRIWHERANTLPGAIEGMSVVAYAARTMGTSLAAERFGHDWFRDGAHPSSVLTSEKQIDDTQAKTILDRIKSKFAGGSREPIVLGAGITYSAIQVSPDESQFLETMRFGTQQVCRFFAVDPELIGADSGSSSLTYANRDQRALDFLTYKFGPTLVRRERALSRLTPNGQFAKFDADELLRTDLKTRYEAHNMAIAGKWQHPDEARHDEDMPPLTDEQKAELDLVPLTVNAAGMPKVAPPATPAPPTGANA